MYTKKDLDDACTGMYSMGIQACSQGWGLGEEFCATTREVIFRCQFHSTAVGEYRLVYTKKDLDDACTGMYTQLAFNREGIFKIEISS